jgi:MFS family permease
MIVPAIAADDATNSRTRCRMPHRPAALVTGAAFLAFGVLYGAWAVLLADLARDLRLTDGPLGLALTAGFVGSLPVMVGGGHLTDRYGARALAIGSGVLLALAYGAIALVGGFAALVVVLFVFYAASGAFDVAINAAAIGVERATGRHLLSAFHAAFSGGGMLGALGAGALLAAGLPFRSAYVAVMVVLLGVAAAWSRIPLPAAPPSASGARGGSLYRDRRLLLLAGITALAFLAEGAMETWSGIYLRTGLALPAVAGAAGVAVFHGAMLAGRAGASVLGRRAAPSSRLRLAGLAAAAAMTFALATTIAPAVIAGFLVVGLALSVVAPLAFSLAGEARPAEAGRASSVITTIGYAGFLFGPGIIGTVAEAATLRIGLLAVVVAGLSIALLAGRVAHR